MTTTADPFAGYLFEPVVAPRFSGRDRRPWARYGRISRRDPREGAGAAVKIEDQLDSAAAYIRNLDPEAEILTFRDNASAWDPEVYREDYERMVAMLAAGELKGVVVWHGDRLTRQVAQASTVWRNIETTGAQLHTVKSGWIQNPLMWQMESVMAENESRVKSNRMEAHHQRLAGSGSYGGGHRRFGYEDGNKSLRESEAEALRSIAARVLGGESLASCVRWLEAEGIPTARGGRWSSSELSAMLRRPHLAGLRTFGTHEDGRPRVVGVAEWPPVFDRATHEALVRKLGDPARRSAASTSSKYLLAGLGRCGCGEVLRARPGRKTKAKAVYVCTTGRHVYREVAVVDFTVSEAIVARLARIDSAGVFLDDTAEAEEAALTVKRDELVARRRDYAARAAAGLIDEDMAADVAAAIATELAAVSEALDAAKEATTRPLAVLQGMTGPLAREAWERASIGRKRELVRLLVETLVLRGGGPRAWDPDAPSRDGSPLLTMEFRRRPGLA